MKKVWEWVKAHPWQSAIIGVATVAVFTILFVPKVRRWVMGTSRKAVSAGKRATQKALGSPKATVRMAA